MNRQQFKAISHDYRELNFKAHTSSHICTARNCSCSDSYLERHTGWQWRIAQQHGEGMATRLANMFAWARRPMAPMQRQTLRNALERYWEKKQRRAEMNVALAMIDQKFRGVEVPQFPTAARVSHGDTDVNLSRSNTNAGSRVAVPFVCAMYGDPS